MLILSSSFPQVDKSGGGLPRGKEHLLVCSRNGLFITLDARPRAISSSIPFHSIPSSLPPLSPVSTGFRCDRSDTTRIRTSMIPCPFSPSVIVVSVPPSRFCTNSHERHEAKGNQPNQTQFFFKRHPNPVSCSANQHFTSYLLNEVGAIQCHDWQILKPGLFAVCLPGTI